MAYRHIGADEPPHIEMPAFDVAAARAERAAVKGLYRGPQLAAQFLASRGAAAPASTAGAARKLPRWAVPAAVGLAAVLLLRRS